MGIIRRFATEEYVENKPINWEKIINTPFIEQEDEKIVLNEEYIPDTIARTSDIVQPDWNQTDVNSRDYIKNKPEITLDGISLVDRGSGKKYNIFLLNGELIISSSCVGIEITTMPDNLTFNYGQELDLTGMVVSAVYEDGTKTVVDDYTFEASENMGEVPVVVTYVEFGQAFTTSFNVNFELQDFTYTAQDDGIIMLNTWKETLNGEQSAGCVIPSSNDNVRFKI